MTAAGEPPHGVATATALPGVSVVLCCHNSTGRLGAALDHLKVQSCAPSVPWEVLVVDNASGDGTADFARSYWPADAPAPLRVVAEPVPGLSHARNRGLRSAAFEYVSFVDDDNWVASDWVAQVFTIFTEHPDVGACGGQITAAFEVDPPPWFEAYAKDFALGQQAPASGDVTWTRGYLWGAGLSIRKSAWTRLIAGGFRQRLLGRTGAALTAGEDTELCYGLRMAGWTLWYEERLQLRHFMPAGRLSWPYVRRLHRGFGIAQARLSVFDAALRLPTESPRAQVTWRREMADAVRAVARLRRRAYALLARSTPGDRETIDLEYLLGRATELWRLRRGFDRAVAEIRDAPWRSRDDPRQAAVALHNSARASCEIRWPGPARTRVLRVEVASPLDDIRCVELFIRVLPGAGPPGAWRQLATIVVGGPAAACEQPLPPDVEAGPYQAAVNVHLARGGILPWYELPERRFLVD